MVMSLINIYNDSCPDFFFPTVFSHPGIVCYTVGRNTPQNLMARNITRFQWVDSDKEIYWQYTLWEC